MVKFKRYRVIEINVRRCMLHNMSVCFIIFYPRYITIVIDMTSTPSAEGEEDGSVFNPQMLRTFRVLRALKTVSIVPGTFPKL